MIANADPLEEQAPETGNGEAGPSAESAASSEDVQQVAEILPADSVDAVNEGGAQGADLPCSEVGPQVTDE